ncbi:MAG: class I SAM-dependent methyltransferase, partial [Actinomycetota bacterium]|nr:class I SAM-dependent methyltransferase [Actinomycetota bacterium]
MEKLQMTRDERKTLVAAGSDEVADAYAALEQPGKEWPRLRLLRDLLARTAARIVRPRPRLRQRVPALREIARLHRAVGVDISKTQTELARANVPHADLVHADVAELAFPARSC